MFLVFLPPAGQNSYVLTPPLSLWKVPSDLSVSVAYSESEVAQSCPLFATLWTVARQAPPPGKNTGVGCHFLLQGVFLTQGLNLGLLHCRQTLHHLSH